MYKNILRLVLRVYTYALMYSYLGCIAAILFRSMPLVYTEMNSAGARLIDWLTDWLSEWLLQTHLILFYNSSSSSSSGSGGGGSTQHL